MIYSEGGYEESQFLQLSGIQHFAFCRRQWALIHIEQQWFDNYLTASGNVLHDRVHDKDVKENRNGTIVVRGMYVKSHKLGLSGICDAVEFSPCGSNEGISLFGRKGFWKLTPVEYKRGKAKKENCDALQVAAQAVCLEEMFSCEIEEAHLFYYETRRREKVSMTSELRQDLMKYTEEMHLFMERGHIPKAKPSKSCKACSLEDVCIPDLTENREPVSQYINRYVKESSK